MNELESKWLRIEIEIQYSNADNCSEKSKEDLIAELLQSMCRRLPENVPPEAASLIQKQRRVDPDVHGRLRERLDADGLAVPGRAPRGRAD